MESQSRLVIHDLTDRELLIFREQVDRRKKSEIATWLLWLFLGGLGGHRFYLGYIGRGIAMFLTLGGLGIWALIDAFFIPGALRQRRSEVEDQILLEMAAMRGRRSEGQ